MVSIQKQIEIVEYRIAIARRYGPKWKVKTFQYELSRLRTRQLKQEMRCQAATREMMSYERFA